MQETYKHTQNGSLMIWVMGLSILVCILTAMAIPQYPMFGLIITGFTVVVLAVCLILFYSLTVEINGAHLEFRFGPGLIRKRIALDQVTSCCVVRNKFIHGWRIHHYGKGWLYNVSGFEAVELELCSGKQLRIGTDEPAQLNEAIKKPFIKHKSIERSAHLQQALPH